LSAATASALDKKELPAMEPGAMCYMMSKQQYLSDHDKLASASDVFCSGDAAKSWGANLPRLAGDGGK
jgi:collagenase-like PrtC family protease